MFLKLHRDLKCDKAEERIQLEFTVGGSLGEDLYLG
jgi:hypothetical protein